MLKLRVFAGFQNILISFSVVEKADLEGSRIISRRGSTQRHSMGPFDHISGRDFREV